MIVEDILLLSSILNTNFKTINIYEDLFTLPFDNLAALRSKC